MNIEGLSELAKALTEGMPKEMKEEIAKGACLTELSEPFIKFRPRVDAAIAANEKTFGFTHEEASAVVESVLHEMEVDYLKAKEEVLKREGLSF